MNLENVRDKFTYKNRFRHQKLCFGPQFRCWRWKFFTDFLWQTWAKNTKINFSSESVTTEEHQESYSCYFSIYVFYKINLRPILKKILQKIDFRHFPLFWKFCPFVIVSQPCLPQLCSALKTLKSKVNSLTHSVTESLPRSLIESSWTAKNFSFTQVIYFFALRNNVRAGIPVMRFAPFLSRWRTLNIEIGVGFFHVE